MALVRVEPTDDSGLGTDGTVFNKAWFDLVYDSIDTALASLGTPQTTTSAGTQNDFAATAARRLVLRCNNATLLTLTGFAAGSDCDTITVISVGAGQVDLSHQAAGSSAANRLINCGTSGATSLAAGVGVATYVYDGTTARWRLIYHEQGAWITPAYSAGDYTAAGSMTWTVDSGDVTMYRYWLKGRTLFVGWQLSTTTIGGSLNTALYIKIPGGFSAAGQATAGVMYANSGSGFLFAAAWVDSGLATKIQLYTAGFGSSNWASGTNNNSSYGEIAVEVT